MKYPRVILAGTNSGVGKTTIVLGITLALQKSGLIVQTFKAGPDYIDPSYHAQASGNICCNLDTWLLPKNMILELFENRAKNADISIIEGVMGLYDGIKNKEEGSTAHLSKILKCPVILIVDAHSLSRSAGAIVLGYKEFDKDINIAGVILNNIGSISHYYSVRDSIEINTNIKVLGFLSHNHNLKLPERHLGLIPTVEKKLLGIFKRKLLNLIGANIDVEKIIKIAKNTEILSPFKERLFTKEPAEYKVFIAVAKDKAFNFYYQDNLDILKHLGAKLIEFSPLRDKKLSQDIDGIYIGGGFPEIFAKELSKNTEIKEEIYRKAKKGLPIYAECGGLMYLMKKLIDFKKIEFPMVGIFKGKVKMGNKLQVFGYVELETIKDNILSKKGDKTKAHVFHWSYLDGLPKNSSFVYKIIKNKDKIFYDGLIKRNVLAGYVHIHFASNIHFAKNFIKSCQRYKNGK